MTEGVGIDDIGVQSITLRIIFELLGYASCRYTLSKTVTEDVASSLLCFFKALFSFNP